NPPPAAGHPGRCALSQQRREYRRRCGVSAREGLTTTARDGGSVDVAGAVIDHLDLWTGAVTKKSSSGRGSNGKVELTGVKKLRELILELAVRGKLVHQNPNEEPAIL